MIYTTLNRIREHSPCQDGWKKLLSHLGKTQADDEPVAFATILESNGLDDALWCCRAEPQYAKQWRLYAVWCARRVQHLMTDPRIHAALDVAERHANGDATDQELAAAWDAASAASEAAWDAASEAARAAARAAAWAAAWDAASAASEAASEAAWDAASAASEAAWDAASEAASEAAWDAASEAARAAARAAARDAMAREFLRVVTETVEIAEVA